MLGLQGNDVNPQQNLLYEPGSTAPNIKVSVYCPGWVSTEFDTIERSRPERFGNSPPSDPLTPEQRAAFRQSLAGGFSIEESADVLFEGLQNDRLYIGPKAFRNQFAEFSDLVRQRAENMLNEQNPELPSVSED